MKLFYPKFEQKKKRSNISLRYNSLFQSFLIFQNLFDFIITCYTRIYVKNIFIYKKLIHSLTKWINCPSKCLVVIITV